MERASRETPQAETSSVRTVAPWTAARPVDRTAVITAQRTYGNAAVARALAGRATLQRMITYTNGAYGHDDRRGSWRPSTNKTLKDMYNLLTNKKFTSIPYRNLNLARAHILAFSAIQAKLFQYVTGGIDSKALTAWVAAVTTCLKPGKERDQIQSHLNALVARVNAGQIGTGVAGAANALLRDLNNLTENLRVADSSVNSYIGEHPDLFFEVKKGQFRLTPHSRALLKAGVFDKSAILRTPVKNERIVSSEGAVLLALMTPESHALLDQHPWTTKAMDAVKPKFVGPTQIANFPPAQTPQTPYGSTSAGAATSAATPGTTPSPPAKKLKFSP